MCAQGLEHLCREVNGKNYMGFVCNGAYAQYFAGREKNAYALPDSVSDVQEALIDPLMVAYHAINRANLKLHDKVLVVGSGIIGQMIAELAKKSGASFVAMSKVSEVKVQKARELGIIDAYFDGNSKERAKELKDASNGGFDVVFEAVGVESSFDTCLDGVKPGGKIVMIGNSVTEKIPLSINRVVLNEISVLGSVSCTRVEFEETIDLIAKGMIDPAKYVTEVISLEGLQKALERQIDPNDPMVKFVVKP